MINHIEPLPFSEAIRITQEEYDKLKASNKLDKDASYIIINDDPSKLVIGIGQNTYDWGSVITDNRYMEEPQYVKNGIRINDLFDMKGIYEAVYTALITNNPQQKENWDLLLKLNDYDYRLTVIQIEQGRLSKEDVKPL